MSYFSSSGSPIRQAAAGLGLLPPQAAAGLGLLPPQAAAGLGATLRMGRLPPQAAAGLGGLVASSGDSAEAPTNVFRDGIFTQGVAEQDYGVLSRPYHDGIFSNPLGATEQPTYDLSDPTLLSEVKRALATLAGHAGNFDDGTWEPATEQAWRQFVAGAGASAPATAAGWTQSVGGHDIPTAAGIVALTTVATVNYDKTTPSNGLAYANKYWPDLLAYAQMYQAGGGGKVAPPRGIGGGGSGGMFSNLSTAAMVGIGLGAAGLVFGGLYLLRHKKS